MDFNQQKRSHDQIEMNRLKRLFNFLFRTHRKKTILATLIIGVAYWFCLPSPLFTDPTALVLEDRNADLLGARIARDGQWRFPFNADVPDKFSTAIIEFEDQRFYHHPGIDPIGIIRALRQNIKEGRVVSGGSTISMQVIRMSRKGKSRSVWQKLIEMILATRLELGYSKSDILAFYASNAPFGGNVVGLDAASWRYFGKNPQLLSWAEAATLAVLPNSPALIHPGRNRQALLDKRNRLLDRLHANGDLDQLSWELAKEEALPDQPHPLPDLAPHLLNRANEEHFKKNTKQLTRLRSTIDRDLQISTGAILQRHLPHLSSNGIHNLSAIIIDVETGNVLAYLGNVKGTGAEHQEAVDVIKAPRSTGSILKPFLYCMALQEGTILPNSLLSDIPTQINGYRPENYHQSYDGMVPASKALVRSLNVPMVRLLQNYGLEQFHYGLNKWGFTTISKPPQHYGLPLILGGAEASLWELTSAYANMSRTLNHYQPFDSRYDPLDFHSPNYVFGKNAPQSSASKRLDEAPFAMASAIWQTFDAMREVQRPDAEGNWEQFQSRQPIAWKTGTSFGFRDAWAVGVTPRYCVGVWAGNADGEGRPGLVGVLAAGPVLFEIFDQLQSGRWFEQPFDEMVQIPVCRESGYRALDICEADSQWVSLSGLKAPACMFHRLIHLDPTGTWQVNSDCESPNEMIHRSWFVIPPVEEYYYRSRNPNYRPLPPFREDCINKVRTDQPMELIYPKEAARIYVPVDLDGNLSRTVFQVAHRDANAEIFWHLDRTYLGSTKDFHSMELNPTEGKHLLTLVDQNGFRLELNFEILQK